MTALERLRPVMVHHIVNTLGWPAPPAPRRIVAQQLLALCLQEHRIGSRLWTRGGYRANATLAATLSHLTVQRFDDASLRLRSDLTPEMWKAGTADEAERICLPDVDQRALAGLKFSEALPERLAAATLAARMADVDSAARVPDLRKGCL